MRQALERKSMAKGTVAGGSVCLGLVAALASMSMQVHTVSIITTITMRYDGFTPPNGCLAVGQGP